MTHSPEPDQADATGVPAGSRNSPSGPDAPDIDPAATPETPETPGPPGPASTVHPDDYLLGSKAPASGFGPDADNASSYTNASVDAGAPAATGQPPPMSAPPMSAPPTSAGPSPSAPAPAALAEPLPKALVAAAVVAFIVGAWFAIEGLVHANDRAWLLQMQQQMAAASPDAPVELSQLSFVLLLLYGSMAVLYTVAGWRLLQLSLGSRLLLVVLGWINIAMFVRMAFIDHVPLPEWIDNAIIGALLVALLSMPTVVRRLYSARVSAARQATMAAAAAMQAWQSGQAGVQPHQHAATATATATALAPAAATSVDPARIAPYPLQLSVHLDERPWGNGRRLRALGKPVPDGATIGESWEVSGHPYAESRVTNGPLAGYTLNQLTLAWGEWLLGPGRQPAAVRVGDDWQWRFPLLAKFLDTAGWLSVQVHPPACDHEPGKSEAWLILSAEPDAAIYQGFARATTADDVREHIAAGTIADLLQKIPVRAGDIVYNPAGVIHAIGPGICLFEVQEVSDATYRLFDFGRTDRELHIDQAIEVLRLEAGVPDRPDAAGAGSLPPTRLGLTGPDAQPVVACEHFRVWRVRMPANGTAGCRAGGDTVALVHHVGGPPVDLVFSDGTSERVSTGDARVIPASIVTNGMRLQVAPTDAGDDAVLLVVTP